MRLEAPEWFTIAPCHVSAPAIDWRHWKVRIPSAPRATAPSDHSSYCPGRFTALRPRHWTAEVTCSIWIHGRPCPRERMRSHSKAKVRAPRGSDGSG